jgi:bifunctional UDP-N-acetylglucosamine pyrophosphorylase/glucosamine-1-phosphate N-acetyltransferase
MEPSILTMQQLPLDILILAAGLGTRMRSNTAKVLHKLDGLPLIAHVYRAAAALNPRKIYVVVGHQAAAVEAAVRAEQTSGEVEFVVQETQRGTGDAVMAARRALENANSTLLILSGDVPLIRPATLAALVDDHGGDGNNAAACTALSVELNDPTGYGRIIRTAAGQFDRIVEQKDSSESERQVREINAGIYCFETTSLFTALQNVKPINAQGEYYLTDVPAILRGMGAVIRIFVHEDPLEVSGINTRLELSEFESIVRNRKIRKLMLEDGVTLIDPSSVYISSEARFGRDCVVYPNVHIEGETFIGEGCEIRSGTRISNSRLGNNVKIKDHCLIVDSQISDDCSVGPFAHLRMGAVMDTGSTVGNFVEVKKSHIGPGSKAMHLSYIGDATIGARTNIGAGTITCNYDGKNKHQTIIEDNVKIGSDTMLVAPVRVGSGAVTAAGAVVTNDVPPDTLVAGVPAKIKKQLISSETASTRG